MTHLKHTIQGLLCWLPLTLFSQSFELLGLYPAGDRYELKARIDLNGKVIREVTVSSFRMSDGKTATVNQYELIENRFLTATPEIPAGPAAYRMRVVLADALSAATSSDTVLLSPCILPGTPDRFMWLGDYTWENASSGWDSAHPPRVDQSVDTRKQMTINDTIYYKGVSNHAPGYIQYRFDQPFERFVTRVGIQDEELNGDARVEILADGVSRETFSVYSKTNPGLQNNLLYKDVSLDMTGVNTLRTTISAIDNNWGDHVHMVMARLYLPENDVRKEPQEVRFETSGGLIPEGTTSIRLRATATSGGAVFYRVVKGTELAEIQNGNELVLKYGVKGEILVEATQYGDDRFACANAVLSFQTDRIPDFRLLTTHRYAHFSEHARMAYFYIDTRGVQPSDLKMQTYNNSLQLTPETTIDLMPLVGDPSFSQPQVIEIPYDNRQSVRFAIRYPGQEEEVWITPYYDQNHAFEYLSDLTTWRAGSSYGSVFVDKAFDNRGAINLCGQLYGKGFGIHANGWVEASIKGGRYNRFIADAGKQNGQPYRMEFTLAMNGNQIATTGSIAGNQKGEWDFEVSPEVETLRLELLQGNDGSGNDHGAIGAPRLYLTSQTGRQQTLTWKKESIIHQSKPFRITLDATTSSGLPVFYHVTKGSAYAAIEHSNQLNVHTVPEKDSIVMEAFQPGSPEWAPTAPASCTFRLTKGRIVQKNERIELEDGEDLEELTVYADATASGQVTVKSGLVNVKKLIVKYLFTPKSWHFITFPTDLNIDKISNLNESGYYLNGAKPGAGAYYIRRYDTRARAEQPDQEIWKPLQSPMVEGMKGYIIGINNFNGTDPREITFEIDNVSLDFESTVRLLNLTLDLTHTEPGATQTVYIAPANAKGNTLKVAVDFQPENPEVLPVNYSRALADARVTFTPNREGIRLTLPDPTPARVVIFDRKMKKVLKAVRYISPMMIDVSDLKPGSYQMVVSYGNATEIKAFTK